MKEVYLLNKGNALVPVSEDGEEALLSYPKGVTLKVRITQDRSLPHHQFFFAFLREVFKAWTDNDIRPSMPDEDMLRAWLTVKAGFYHQFTSEKEFGNFLEGSLAAQMTLKVVKDMTGGRPIWAKVDSEGIVDIRWPKSIAFNKMDEQEFRDYTGKVFALIYQRAGLDVEEHYQKYIEKNPPLKVVPFRFRSAA